VRLTIEKLIYGGDGLARLPADDKSLEHNGRGKAAFIPFVLEGEMVDATLTEQKQSFARARVDHLLKPSPQRITAPCPYFSHCGGCHYQHTNYAHQLGIKAAILRENLLRIAKLELDIELKIHPSPEWNYRNRSRFTVRPAPDFALCYHKFNSHELLPVEQCPISSPLINKALHTLLVLGRIAHIPQHLREIEIFSNADDSQLLVEIYCDPEVSTPEIEKWLGDVRGRMPEIVGITAFQNESARSFAAREFASAGKKEITYQTADASYRVSAGSFFQVNRFLTADLVKVVTGRRAGNTALDLYAGVGLFSSVLYRDFHRVIAVESSPTSYSDLLYNSAPNVKAVHSTTEQYLKNALKKLRPDFVVIDPPRAGLSSPVLKDLIAMHPPEIAYVSCDPATAARDLRELLGSGYKMQQAHLVDLFPQTFHIESVFHLRL